ncbi:SDR family NAD(P)-dependent oxidoreductase [Adlercreutzia sp. ZJ242]|uniref:SDR family NAD(P)-dependent oxidoreductase n=1 Tax=Adlercreutzia sp. ZJ242 TaxID=2709409 RepID=UPI0013EDD4C2|nr:SDR family oxidoreductase [Adlercreutzia sp. ZJ242]
MSINETYDLTGRVALITGASSHGIGNSSAKALAEAGAKVFLTARREEQLKAACAEIEAAGGTAAYAVCDVSSEEQCKAAVDACVETFGQLDIMVLSAGISGLSASGGPDAWFDTDNWNKMIGINLEGVFWMIKHGWAECAKGGHGSIIPVGSLASWHCDGSAAYTAGKGALRSLVAWFGKKFPQAGIPVRVNGLYPGLIRTDMTQQACDHEVYGPMMLKPIPLGRFGEPEDCANAVLFLASDASAWMTGQHMVIDGGQLA